MWCIARPVLRVALTALANTSIRVANWRIPINGPANVASNATVPKDVTVEADGTSSVFKWAGLMMHTKILNPRLLDKHWVRIIAPLTFRMFFLQLNHCVSGSRYSQFPG